MTEKQLEKANITRQQIKLVDSNINTLNFFIKAELPSMGDLPQHIYENQKNIYLEAYKKDLKALELFKKQLQNVFEKL